MNNSLLQQFKHARAAATPLICIRTADPGQTINGITKSFNGSAPPIAAWDVIRGFTPVNPKGEAMLRDLNVAGSEIPFQAFQGCEKMPPDTVVFFHNMHRIIGENGISQAIWNLRDKFKAPRRTLVMLCPDIEIPAELQHDVVVFDEPLPSVGDLAAIACNIYRSADMPLPDQDTLDRITDATCGLSAFSAEQVCAMSLRKAGMDLDALWERKRQAIEATPGLSVWRGGETFLDIRGCQNAIDWFTMAMNGEQPPHAVIWIDEIEKQFAGSGTDTSGVSTEMIGQVLPWMQELPNLQAVLLIGPPGCAKSMVAKCAGGTFQRPTIGWDLGAMKNSLVGESTARLRQAFRVIEAVSQGNLMIVATCNSFGDLSPEMKRRFKNATFYFDLPDAEERQDIWDLYTEKFQIPGERAVIPEDADWTGAEIRTCCESAWRYRISLQRASEYIVPVARSNSGLIDKLRTQADGRFISASYPGVYRRVKAETASAGMRKLEVL